MIIKATSDDWIYFVDNKNFLEKESYFLWSSVFVIDPYFNIIKMNIHRGDLSPRRTNISIGTSNILSNIKPINEEFRLTYQERQTSKYIMSKMSDKNNCRISLRRFWNIIGIRDDEIEG